MCPLMNEKDTEFECCLAVALTKIPRGSETETAIAVHYMVLRAGFVLSGNTTNASKIVDPHGRGVGEEETDSWRPSSVRNTNGAAGQ